MKLSAINSLGAAAVLTASALFLAAPAAHADTFTFTAADASAIITTSNGSILVQLFSLDPNPTSAADEVSGLTFNLSSGSYTLGSLSASSPNSLIDIAANGSFTNDAASITHWGDSLTGTSVCLATSTLSCTVGGPPKDLIIGTGIGGATPYSASNPSITGKNPQIQYEGDFILTIAGVSVSDPKTSDGTQISNVVFHFGTGVDDDHPESGDPTPTPSVPEPSSLLLLGTGILGAAGAIRRKVFKV
jgi:hypothetical protein